MPHNDDTGLTRFLTGTLDHSLGPVADPGVQQAVQRTREVAEESPIESIQTQFFSNQAREDELLADRARALGERGLLERVGDALPNNPNIRLLDALFRTSTERKLAGIDTELATTKRRKQQARDRLGFLQAESGLSSDRLSRVNTESLVETRGVTTETIVDPSTGRNVLARINSDGTILGVIGLAPEKKPIVQVLQGSFGTELGKKMADQLVEGHTKAMDAAESLRASKEAETLLDEGIITGFGANFILGFGKFLNQAGVRLAPDAIDNSQTFMATRAQEVGRIIKLFGAGTGLSDADREFAQKAAAGDITVSEGAIRRILSINNRAAENVISLHNQRVRTTTEGSEPLPFNLIVDLPGQKRVIDFSELRSK